MKQISFAPGPAALPAKVLQRIRSTAYNWQGTGTSIMEVSHRSKEYLQLHKQLQARLYNLLNIPKSYKILLLSGGARAQFSAVPLNLCKYPKKSQAIYIINGYWSNMAMEMAQVKPVPMAYGLANNIPQLSLLSNPSTNKSANKGANKRTNKSTSKDASAILANYKGKAAYVHCCLNETIEGVRIPQLPISTIPLVADISSCIASYPLDFKNLHLAYACAQKNLGIAGLTLVIINPKLLKCEPSPYLPHVLSYQHQAAADSLLNTPTTFAVYVCNLMCEWIEEQGGVASLAKINQLKADAIYEQIDKSDGFYSNQVQQELRSLTNVVFSLPNKKLENSFLAEAAKQGLMNLRGHSAGGGAIRASIYNAISANDVKRLCKFMRQFRNKLNPPRK